jgi:hypothetical protein
MVIAAAGLALLWGYSRMSNTVDLRSLLSERASLQADASGGIHFDLIARGLDVFGSGPWQFMFGIGPGNSPVVLQDFFPGNPYANFHSIYVTSLVEGGLLGAFLLLYIMFRPLVFGRPILVILGASFGVFYQANLDPTSWLVISLAWCAPLAATVVDSRSHGDEAVLARGS